MSKLLFDIIKENNEKKQMDTNSNVNNVLDENKKDENISHSIDEDIKTETPKEIILENMSPSKRSSQDNGEYENNHEYKSFEENDKSQEDVISLEQSEQNSSFFSDKISGNINQYKKSTEKNIFFEKITSNINSQKESSPKDVFNSTKDELIADVLEAKRKPVIMEIMHPNPAEIRKNIIEKIKKEQYTQIKKKKVSLDDLVEKDPVLGAIIDQLKYVKTLKKVLEEKKNLTRDKIEEIERLLDENLKVLEGKEPK